MSKFYQKFSCCFLKTIIAILFLVLLNACSNDSCVDADDFGFNKKSVSSQATTGINVSGEQGNQIIDWASTGLVATGQPFVVKVRNITVGSESNSWWTSWFGTPGTVTIPDFMAAEPIQSQICVFGTQAYAANGMTFDTSLTCPVPTALYAPVTNAPCLFTKGVGLYALVADPTHAGTPNQDTATQLNPSLINATTMHLGITTNLNDNYDSAGGFNGPMPSSVVPGGQIYLKILDHYYADNVGEYSVVFMSGTRTPDAGAFAELIKMVDDMLNTATQAIYQALVDPSKTEFVSYVRLLLTLYVMFSSICFMFGIIEMTHKEFIVRIFKIAIIVTLISDQSFAFFNKFFFVFFSTGVIEIIDLLGQQAYGTAANINVNGAQTLTIFDDLVHDYISSQTFTKLMGLLSGEGFAAFMVVLAIFAMIAIYVFTVIKAVILFLLAQIAIAILIVLAPIFISFSLFKFTRNLFDNWMKQLISYALQPIIIIAGLLMINYLVLEQFHKLLGFKVCAHRMIPGLEFYYWSPEIRWEYPPQPIPVPDTFINSDGQECLAYQCVKGLRYVDLPYLEVQTDAATPNDQLRIDAIHHGDYVTFTDAFNFLILILIFVKFTELTPVIARELAGAGVTAPDLQTAANAAGKSLKSGAFGAVDKALAYARKGHDAAWEKMGFKNADGSVQKTSRLFQRYDEGKQKMKDVWDIVQDPMKTHKDKDGKEMRDSKGNLKFKDFEGVSLLSRVSSKLDATGDAANARIDAMPWYKRLPLKAVTMAGKIAVAPLTIGKSIYDKTRDDYDGDSLSTRISNSAGNAVRGVVSKSETGQKLLKSYDAAKDSASQAYNAISDNKASRAIDEAFQRTIGSKMEEEDHPESVLGKAFLMAERAVNNPTDFLVDGMKAGLKKQEETKKKTEEEAKKRADEAEEERHREYEEATKRGQQDVADASKQVTNPNPTLGQSNTSSVDPANLGTVPPKPGVRRSGGSGGGGGSDPVDDIIDLL